MKRLIFLIPGIVFSLLCVSCTTGKTDHTATVITATAIAKFAEDNPAPTGNKQLVFLKVPPLCALAECVSLLDAPGTIYKTDANVSKLKPYFDAKLQRYGSYLNLSKLHFVDDIASIELRSRTRAGYNQQLEYILMPQSNGHWEVVNINVIQEREAAAIPEKKSGRKTVDIEVIERKAPIKVKTAAQPQRKLKQIKKITKPPKRSKPKSDDEMFDGFDDIFSEGDAEYKNF